MLKETCCYCRRCWYCWEIQMFCFLLPWKSNNDKWFWRCWICVLVVSFYFAICSSFDGRMDFTINSVRSLQIIIDGLNRHRPRKWMDYIYVYGEYHFHHFHHFILCVFFMILFFVRVVLHASTHNTSLSLDVDFHGLLSTLFFFLLWIKNERKNKTELSQATRKKEERQNKRNETNTTSTMRGGGGGGHEIKPVKILFNRLKCNFSRKPWNLCGRCTRVSSTSNSWLN